MYLQFHASLLVTIYLFYFDTTLPLTLPFSFFPFVTMSLIRLELEGCAVRGGFSAFFAASSFVLLSALFFVMSLSAQPLSSSETPLAGRLVSCKKKRKFGVFLGVSGVGIFCSPLLEGVGDLAMRGPLDWLKIYNGHGTTQASKLIYIIHDV